MTLPESNTQYVALKFLADLVKERMDAIKAEHLEALVEFEESTNVRQHPVKLGEEEIAKITLTQPTLKAKITDEAALVAAIEQVHPEMVEYRLKPWAKKQLEESIVDVVEDGGVTTDGEVLPGIDIPPGGRPYQSVRYSKHGKLALEEALRDGALKDLLDRAGLPMIGGPR